MIGPFALIIGEGVLKNGSDVFNILDPDSGGASSFRVALSASGGAPVTHYGAYTYLQPATVDALRGTTTAFKTYVDRLAVERGRTPVGAITGFKGSLLMSEQGANFWQFIAANGLQPIVTPL